jgi:Protein kinase domain
VSDQLVVGGQLGNYLIDSVLGRGGMSVVYRAKHSRLGMSVALKVLAPELSSDDVFRERFLREAQMAAAVDHPNVIPIHDMGVHEQSLYIVMRYVAGGDLKAQLASSGPLDPHRAVELLMPVAQALDTAHAHGLVHRDVKPANILLQRSSSGEVEHVYLSDFGIAKSATSMTALTSAGSFIGTVEYMAPEQLESREVSARTDVYALAATFYECITGRIPFQRELAEGARPPLGPVEPVGELRPGLPATLDPVIAKALSRDPVARQVSCEQLLAECEAALGGRAARSDSAVAAAIAPTEASGGEPLGAQAAAPPTTGPDAGAGAAPPPPDAAAGARVGSGESDRQGDRTGPDRARGGAGPSRRRWYAGALVAVLAAAAAVLVVVLASGSSTPGGRLASSPLAAVPENHVTGSGRVSIRLDGDRAEVTVTTQGLDEDAPLVHAMHIHAGGKGECPPASAARVYNGHRAISTNDGLLYYGPPVQALTTRGDTSVASILAFPRFLTGGTLHYKRTITLPAKVAEYIRANNAVVVVHGIDYDHSGIYSGVLERSELNNSLPATATAPALCGRVVGPQEVAAAGSRGRSLLYTASLGQLATSSPLGGQFLCHVPEGIGAVETRRQRIAAAPGVVGATA